MVHKELEKEIRPVEIRVDVTTAEERWALRCGPNWLTSFPFVHPY